MFFGQIIKSCVHKLNFKTFVTMSFIYSIEDQSFKIFNYSIQIFNYQMNVRQYVTLARDMKLGYFTVFA